MNHLAVAVYAGGEVYCDLCPVRLLAIAAAECGVLVGSLGSQTHFTAWYVYLCQIRHLMYPYESFLYIFEQCRPKINSLLNQTENLQQAFSNG